MPKSLVEIREELEALGGRLDTGLSHDRSITWLWAIVIMLVNHLIHEEEIERVE